MLGLIQEECNKLHARIDICAQRAHDENKKLFQNQETNIENLIGGLGIAMDEQRERLLRFVNTNCKGRDGGGTCTNSFFFLLH